MAAFLIVPIIIIVALIVIAVVYFGGATRRERQRLETLPAEPYARQEAELDHLRHEHADADPARTQHPARRP